MDGSWGVTFVQRVFGPVMMMFATETHVCTSSICWSMQQQRANDTSQRLEIDIYGGERYPGPVDGGPLVILCMQNSIT